MQKLVTIYLDNMFYAKSKMILGFGEKHGLVEEHLRAYLAEGWQIASMTTMGGTAEGISIRGWLIVLLEKK